MAVVLRIIWHTARVIGALTTLLALAVAVPFAGITEVLATVVGALTVDVALVFFTFRVGANVVGALTVEVAVVLFTFLVTARVVGALTVEVAVVRLITLVEARVVGDLTTLDPLAVEVPGSPPPVGCS